MLRLGRASSARSKKTNSTREAERENRLKFVPPPWTVAPRGWLLPGLESWFMEGSQSIPSPTKEKRSMKNPKKQPKGQKSQGQEFPRRLG